MSVGTEGSSPPPTIPPRRWMVPRDSPRVIVALAVLLAIIMAGAVFIGVWGFVRAGDALEQLEAQQNASQSSRTASSQTICSAVNGNANSINKLTSFLQQLAVDGAKRATTPPSEQDRLREAKRIAGQLEELKAPLFDCDAYAAAVSQNLKPPAPVPPPVTIPRGG